MAAMDAARTIMPGAVQGRHELRRLLQSLRGARRAIVHARSTRFILLARESRCRFRPRAIAFDAERLHRRHWTGSPGGSLKFARGSRTSRFSSGRSEGAASGKAGRTDATDRRTLLPHCAPRAFLANAERCRYTTRTPRHAGVVPCDRSSRRRLRHAGARCDPTTTGPRRGTIVPRLMRPHHVEHRMPALDENLDVTRGSNFSGDAGKKRRRERPCSSSMPAFAWHGKRTARTTRPSF